MGKRSSAELCIGGACNWSDLDTVLLALLLGWLEGDIHQCLLGQSDQPFEQSNRNSFVIILSFMQTSSKSPLCPALLCITMYNHQLFHIPGFCGVQTKHLDFSIFWFESALSKEPKLLKGSLYLELLWVKFRPILQFPSAARLRMAKALEKDGVFMHGLCHQKPRPQAPDENFSP